MLFLQLVSRCAGQARAGSLLTTLLGLKSCTPLQLQGIKERAAARQVVHAAPQQQQQQQQQRKAGAEAPEEDQAERSDKVPAALLFVVVSRAALPPCAHLPASPLPFHCAVCADSHKPHMLLPAC